MSTSVTLSISISRPAGEAFCFLADPTNMSRWAIHNVKSIRPLGNNLWEIQTPRGPGSFASHFQELTVFWTTSSSIQKKDPGVCRLGLCRLDRRCRCTSSPW